MLERRHRELKVNPNRFNSEIQRPSMDGPLRSLGVYEPYERVVADPELMGNVLQLASNRMLDIYGAIDEASKADFTSQTARISRELYTTSPVQMADNRVIPAEVARETALRQAEQMIFTASVVGGSDIVVFPKK